MEVAPPRRRFWSPTGPTYVVVDGDILDVAGHAVTYDLRVRRVHVFDVGICVYFGNKVQKKREILFLQELSLYISLSMERTFPSLITFQRQMMFFLQQHLMTGDALYFFSLLSVVIFL